MGYWFNDLWIEHIRLKANNNSSSGCCCWSSVFETIIIFRRSEIITTERSTREILLPMPWCCCFCYYYSWQLLLLYLSVVRLQFYLNFLSVNISFYVFCLTFYTCTSIPVSESSILNAFMFVCLYMCRWLSYHKRFMTPGLWMSLAYLYTVSLYTHIISSY